LVNALTDDPAPDLVRFAPKGKLTYVSLRGPLPLTGNNATVNNAKGSTLGLGLIRVSNAGRSGRLIQVFRTTNLDATNVERSDSHGIGVRAYRTANHSTTIDQSADGSANGFQQAFILPSASLRPRPISVHALPADIIPVHFTPRSLAPVLV
jgi:hypothetical protein